MIPPKSRKTKRKTAKPENSSPVQLLFWILRCLLDWVSKSKASQMSYSSWRSHCTMWSPCGLLPALLLGPLICASHRSVSKMAYHSTDTSHCNQNKSSMHTSSLHSTIKPITSMINQSCMPNLLQPWKWLLTCSQHTTQKTWTRFWVDQEEEEDGDCHVHWNDWHDSLSQIEASLEQVIFLCLAVIIATLSFGLPNVFPTCRKLLGSCTLYDCATSVTRPTMPPSNVAGYEVQHANHAGCEATNDFCKSNDP